MNTEQVPPMQLSNSKHDNMGGAGTTPEQFLQYLRNLLTQYLSDDTPNRIRHTDGDWDTLILGLSDNFFASFLLPGSIPWNAMKEKLTLLDSALEIIHRAAQQVDGLFSGQHDAACNLCARLVNLCNALDVWIDRDVEVEDGVPLPIELRDKSFKALIALLRSFGGNIVRIRQSEEPRWKVLRHLLNEFVQLVSDLLSSTAPVILPTSVMPFQTPRVQTKPTTVFDTDLRGKPVELSVTTPSQLGALLVLLVDVVTHALYPPVISQWFLSDATFGLHKVFGSVFNYLLSTNCSLGIAARAKVLSSLISSVTILCKHSTYADHFSHMAFRLLQFRIIQDTECIEFDQIVLKANELHGKVPVSESDANEVIRLLCAGPSEQLSDLLVAYLRAILPYASERLRRKIKQALSDDNNLKIRYEALITEVEQCDARAMADEQVKDTMPQQVLSQAASTHWRQRVRVAAEAIVNKHHYSWMEIDGDDVTDRQYAQFNLYQIRDYFEGKHSKESPTTKDEVVAKVSNLICVLARCDNTRCNGKTQYIDVSALLDILDLIVRGPTDQVTNAVHQQMYHILSHGIRHYADGASPVEWNRASHTVMKGIVEKDRSVRLAAGGALNALLEASSSDSESNEVTSQILSYLYQVLETAKMPINETIIIAMGNCGETRNSMLLGQVLCLLIAQLGRPNPVIRGLACVKFLAIVKRHNKTPYSIIQPYLDQIAPFLICRMYSQPALFHEACRAMGIPPNQFIVSNLSRALPQLFVDCEKAVLESVSKELRTKISSLFLKNSHKILAHAFLQTGQTKKAVNFILTTLVADSHDGSIDILSVIKSCLLPLLAELVVNLGDDSLNSVEMTKRALQEVQRYLMPNVGKGRSLPLPDLGAFLKNHILGILSGINDMLQGVQGKKSLDVKRKIVRSIGSLVTFIGGSVSSVAPQVMAIFQTMIGITELSEPTIESWHQFLSVLGPADLGPHVGPTSAAFVTSWQYLNPRARDLAAQTLANIVLGLGAELGPQLDEIADLSQIEDLKYIQDYIQGLRSNWTSRQKLRRILHQCKSDNLTVSTRSLTELRAFMLLEQHDVMIELTSGDIFDPMTGKILEVLFSIACRDGDATQQLRLLAFECIGILGAVDPDRCEIAVDDPTMIVLSNFTDENESMRFALHLISDLLVGAFRSTSDMAYQMRLAYVIQELLKFCQFTPALVAVGNSGGSVPLKVRNRWNQLPKRVLETVSPLLEARYTSLQQNHPEIQLPVYPRQSTYRDWIQTWTFHLINRVAGETAQKIFGILRSIVRYKDVVASHHILPHLVLNVLISGNEDDVQTIRSEFLAVLEDQVDSTSDSSFDKKLLSAQVVFMLLDHLSKWVRIIRQEINSKKSENKRARANQVYSHAEEQLLRVDSMLSSIDQHLMARAAFQCKAYARSLMNYESQILMVQRLPPNKDLPNYYEKMHEIYAHLDEPDGMEGVSTLILAPSLEHQIRQHESTGRWTSAQSCWELKLRQSPDNIDYHLGLLRCLRNLGHYDSLRTHVRGILTRNPEWESTLIGYELESAWMVGAWDDVKVMAERATIQTEHVAMARALLAMRSGDPNATSEALRIARTILGAPIAAAGATGYRRAYDAVLNLHQMHELEKIYDVISAFPTGSQPRSQLQRREILGKLSLNLTARLDATLPTFRTREPILSMRRTAFALTLLPRHMLAREFGRSWIASAKIARKANQWQTAYSAMLQAQQGGLDLSFVESAKLVKARGESQQALRELENAMRLIGYIPDGADVLDLTVDDDESKAIKAKAQVLRARWMYESDRFGLSHVHKMFSEAEQTLPAWESGHFRLGQFHDECYKALSPVDKLNRGLKMNLSTVRSYAKAIKVGSKYVYQTVPRVLTIWLDLAERQANDGKEGLSDAQAKEAREREALFKKVNDIVAKVIKDSPVYKWYTAFPQIVSRVGISNDDAYKHLSNLISRVIEEYPKQSLWLFTSVIKSAKDNRAERGRRILDRLRNNPSNARPYLSKLINQSIIMTNELLALCDCRVDDDKKQLSMNKDFPRLAALGRSELIIPLQESLTANLPPTSALESTHQPFPSDAPTFEGPSVSFIGYRIDLLPLIPTTQEFSDEIDVMRSLAKPRKITIRGSNGQIYMFLGKPKDDLRKDARIMDFNSIVNKLLKANSESRRRQLHIRTYGVVTLNEECGFIQWVPNTLPIRPVLLKYYDAKRIRSWSGEMNDIFRKIKDAGDKEAGRLFSEQILPMFPPVFHEWFIETFPEPSAWFTSRLTYSRTAAVMSMVGFILGLGDRHCENILLDVNTGDVVHVDFNCLFEKGKTLETPERVPFRLSQNMVVGCGVTGIEGVFRIACEVTLQLLRDNKDSLMNVLDAFIHDPLVEWEDEKRKLEREPTKRNQVKASVDLGMLARNALNPIEKKLKGIHMTNKEKVEKECSTSTLVQILIQEATDLANLAKMYPGWAPWH